MSAQASFPLVSVITIVYNGEEFIERTIKSVLSQSYKFIDYIIVDGGSNDTTRSIIQKYESAIAFWVSEPDRGLYDAMNKGIRASKGQYLLFMNAGDVFYDDHVLDKMIGKSDNFPDVVYGETMMVDEAFNPLGLRSIITPHKLPKQLKWQNMALGMVVCHQSILVKKSISKEFSLEYRYCADIDWIIQALKSSTKVVNAELIVSNYLKGGLSDKKRRASLLDRFNVLSKHFGLFKTIISHIFILFRALFFYKLNSVYWFFLKKHYGKEHHSQDSKVL